MLLLLLPLPLRPGLVLPAAAGGHERLEASLLLLVESVRVAVHERIERAGRDQQGHHDQEEFKHGWGLSGSGCRREDLRGFGYTGKGMKAKIKAISAEGRMSAMFLTAMPVMLLITLLSLLDTLLSIFFFLLRCFNFCS